MKGYSRSTNYKVDDAFKVPTHDDEGWYKKAAYIFEQEFTARCLSECVSVEKRRPNFLLRALRRCLINSTEAKMSSGMRKS